MGFLDHDFDLKGTSFSQKDLHEARGCWQFLVKKVAPEWLQDPRGHLAIHWQLNTVPSVVRLIYMARMLSSLKNAITKDSNATFENKLRKLLFSIEIQYKEQFTELIVGALLTRFRKPIKMEPISSEILTENTIPGTVDYRVDWADKHPFFVESTVFHIQRLLDWESAIDDLKRRFERVMIHQSLNRELNIIAPLELTRKALSIQEIDEALRFVAANIKGRHSVRLINYDLDLEWQPVPHFEKLPEGGLDSLPGFAFTTGSGLDIGMVAATQVALKWPGDAEELVNRSLRNTLDGKRRQFKLKSPYLLVLRIVSSRIPFEGVCQILNRRIYNNDKYRWLSAIGLLKVSFGQRVGYTPQVKLMFNPNATKPLPESFVTHDARRV